MYEYLKGIITKITAKYIVLEVNGIGYILHVANPYAYSGQVNQSRRPSGLRKTIGRTNSLAHRTTWLRSDLSSFSV